MEKVEESVRKQFSRVSKNSSAVEERLAHIPSLVKEIR